MALSNIGREPRREITESLIGILAFAAYIVGDWFFVTKVLRLRDIPDVGFFMLAVGILGPCVIFLALIATHALGEIVCDLMQAAGLDPRPRRRY